MNANIPADKILFPPLNFAMVLPGQCRTLLPRVRIEERLSRPSSNRSILTQHS